MVLAASYTDKGGNNIKALTGNSTLSLQSNTVAFTGNEKVKGFTPYKAPTHNLFLFPSGEGWFAFDNIDLTGVRSVNLTTGWQTPPKKGLSFEARLDATDGKLLGKGSIPAPAKGQQYGIIRVPIEMVNDAKFHSVYFIYKGQEPIGGGVMSVQFNPK